MTQLQSIVRAIYETGGALEGLRTWGQEIWTYRVVQIYSEHLNVWGAYKHMGVYRYPLSLHI